MFSKLRLTHRVLFCCVYGLLLLTNVYMHLCICTLSYSGQYSWHVDHDSCLNRWTLATTSVGTPYTSLNVMAGIHGTLFHYLYHTYFCCCFNVTGIKLVNLFEITANLPWDPQYWFVRLWNHARIRSCNQPGGLPNGKMVKFRVQEKTRYPLGHAATDHSTCIHTLGRKSL